MHLLFAELNMSFIPTTISSITFHNAIIAFWNIMKNDRILLSGHPKSVNITILLCAPVADEKTCLHGPSEVRGTGCKEFRLRYINYNSWNSFTLLRGGNSLYAIVWLTSIHFKKALNGFNHNSKFIQMCVCFVKTASCMIYKLVNSTPLHGSGSGWRMVDMAVNAIKLSEFFRHL